jgi:single-strand DNA-binding protein
MANSMNKVLLIGNVGQEPEIKTIPSGSQVCKISLATSERYKDKSTGEWKETTEWHNVVMWDFLAERAQKYIKKGSKILIEGKNQTRSYEKDGVTHYRTEVIARDLILLDPKPYSSSESFGEKTVSEDTVSSTDDDDIPF